MRSYGSGHFEIRRRTLKSGKVNEFGYGYVLSEFPVSDGNHRHYASGKTKRDAEANARRKADKHDQKCREALSGTVPTLNEFVDEWMSSKKLTASSYKKYLGHRKHLCGFVPPDSRVPLGEIPVNRITFTMLERCYAKFCIGHKGKSPANFRDVVSEIFGRLEKRDLIRKNIAENLPAAKRNFKTRRLHFRRADLGTFVQYIDDPKIKAAFILGLHGLRASEFLGARFEGIKGNTLIIERQFAPIRNPLGTSPATTHGLCELKHAGHVRDIHLSDAEMSIIMASVESSKTCEVYDEVEKKWVNATFLLPNTFGAGWAYNDFRLQWARVCEKAGMWIRPHDLRRAFSSQSHTDRTLSQAALCEALGHRDFATTTIYIFAEDEEVQAVHDRASEWIGGMLSPADPEIIGSRT